MIKAILKFLGFRVGEQHPLDILSKERQAPYKVETPVAVSQTEKKPAVKAKTAGRGQSQAKKPAAKKPAAKKPAATKSRRQPKAAK